MSITNAGLPACAAVLVVSAVLFAWGCQSSPDQGGAVDAKAAGILSKMSERLSSADRLAIRAERVFDAGLLPEGEALDRAQITLFVARPNRFTATAKGEGDERRLSYDGKTFAFLDVDSNVYGVTEFEGDLDAVFDRLEEKLGIDPPLVDFLRAEPNTALLEFVTAGKYVGEETVDGAVRHHLHFTEDLIEWDLWVTAADFLPHRMVIHATSLEGNPKARVDFHDFDLAPAIKDAAFAFSPPAGAVKAEMMSSEDLAD